jgi:hypothetical protein
MRGKLANLKRPLCILTGLLRISTMVQADIDLTDDEHSLLGQITFDWDFRRHDPEGFARNSEAVAQLITALLERSAIPEHRLKYFTDPDYRKGRIKGSRRDLFPQKPQ